MRHIIPVLLILAGCAAKADDKRPTYTEALESFRSEVASVNATLGNQTAELEGVKEQLKAVDKRLGKIESLLSADTEINVEVPKAADPPKVDAPPAESEHRQRIVYFNGKSWDVDGTIAANYRRMWTFPGNIDMHLADHGVQGFEGLDYETKRKLHSAIHEMDEKAVVKARTVVKAPIVTLPMASGGCPNGRCPNMQYGYYQSRSRLFGRR